MADLHVDRGGHRLAVDEAGEGTPVVALHGLTATRRYVLMGSRHLERHGYRVIDYDARGHGESDPAPEPGAYGYDALAGDLLAVLDDRDIDRALLVGASMGAHTIIALALAHPERCAGLCVVTPGHDPGGPTDERLERWDALSQGLRDGGTAGFLEAFGDPDVPEKWRSTILTVVRQRLDAHEHPDAVADALSAVPRSSPFDDWSQLGELEMPSVVVASRDDADAEHPQALAERYAAELGDAHLRVEREGASPLAWQGGQLSRVIEELKERT